MIKKYLLFIVIALSIFSFSTSPAEATSSADQACTLESSSSDFMGINLTENRAYQIFSPTKNTLDSIEFILGTTNPGLVKAKVRIIYVQDTTGHQRGLVLAEKYISVRGTQYVDVDFDDFAIDDGIYSVSVEAVHDDEIVYWPVTEGNCYPGGYAIVNDQTRLDWDFLFTVMTYDSVPAPENSTSSGSSSSSTGAIREEPSSSSSSAPSTIQPSTPSIQNLPSNSQRVDKGTISGQTTAAVTSDTNQKNEMQDKLMSDQELREQIAAMFLDIEQQKEKNNGAFGLSGKAGEMLTWPVFYTICALVLLLIVIKVILYISKKKQGGVSSEVKY